MTWKWFDCLHGIYGHVGLNRSYRKIPGPARLIFFSLERWSSSFVCAVKTGTTLPLFSLTCGWGNPMPWIPPPPHCARPALTAAPDRQPCLTDAGALAPCARLGPAASSPAAPPSRPQQRRRLVPSSTAAVLLAPPPPPRRPHHGLKQRGIVEKETKDSWDFCWLC